MCYDNLLDQTVRSPCEEINNFVTRSMEITNRFVIDIFFPGNACHFSKNLVCYLYEAWN